jgi:Flp pilus assembly protein TadG
MKRFLHKRVRLHPGDKHGQSLILFALLLPLMLLFAAFAIDAAHAFVDRYRGLPQTS